MDIAPIKTTRDYRRTLKEIEGLMNAKRDTAEGTRLDVAVPREGGDLGRQNMNLCQRLWIPALGLAGM